VEISADYLRRFLKEADNFSFENVEVILLSMENVSLPIAILLVKINSRLIDLFDTKFVNHVA
jgi:hypothetical protein